MPETKTRAEGIAAYYAANNAYRAGRLYPLRHHHVQAELWRATTREGLRFPIVPAGRRSGKTELAKRRVAKAVYEAINAPWPDPRFFLAAPTRDQAKQIYWADLKAMIPRHLLLERPRETDLSLTTLWGCEVFVIGMDRPERIEGRPWDGGVLDEFANMKETAFSANVRPALADRRGWCWLIGVPEGRNHYYELNQYALSGQDPEFASFTWPSADILDPAEVASARRQLDPLVFEQEYEASFVNFTGRAYYAFNHATHCAPLRQLYNPRAPLIFCFDFNVEPGVACVAQELTLPKQYERDASGTLLLDKPVTGTAWIGEVHIPRNSNTPAVVRKLLEQWGEHRGDVRCYGDASGGAEGSAKVQGSDWDLIRRDLKAHYGIERVSMAGVPRQNPPQRSRVNAVNSRLLAGDIGHKVVRMMVDPAACPNLVKDLEGTRLLEGGSGEIDKKHDPKLTHLSDALGYYIAREFPIIRAGAIVAPLRA